MPNNYQRYLGWEHIDLDAHVFRCRWHTKKLDLEQPPYIASTHKNLGNALRENGNLARNWQKDNGKIEGKQTLATSVWLLSKAEEVCLVLTVDFIPKGVVPPDLVQDRYI